MMLYECPKFIIILLSFARYKMPIMNNNLYRGGH